MPTFSKHEMLNINRATVCLMLFQHPRQWHSIDQTLGACLVFARLFLRQ